MKSTVSLSIAVLFCLLNVLKGQDDLVRSNLITNGGFEENKGKFSKKNPLKGIKSWDKATSIPVDLVTNDSLELSTRIPFLSEGIEPLEGNFSAAIAAFSMLNTYKRSYLICELNKALEKNETYEISFDIKLHPRSKYGIKGIGIYPEKKIPDNEFVEENLIYGEYFTSFHHDLSDKGEAVRYTIAFQAYGKEEHIIIGNFIEGTFEDYVEFESEGAEFPPIPAAVYIIDNVVLEKKLINENLIELNRFNQYEEAVPHHDDLVKINTEPEPVLDLKKRKKDKKDNQLASEEGEFQKGKTEATAESQLEKEKAIVNKPSKPVVYRKPGDPEVVFDGTNLVEGRTVIFDEYSTALNNVQYDQVDKIIQEFKKSKQATLTITARTSFNESQASQTNRLLRSLSQHRLRSVKTYLELKGIDPEKIKTVAQPFNAQKLEGGSPTVSFDF